MLAEFVQKLVDLAGKAQKPHKFEDPNLHQTHVLLPDGDRLTINERLAYVDFRLYDLKSLADAIAYLLGDPDNVGTVLISRDEIRVLSDVYHDNRLTIWREDIVSTAYSSLLEHDGKRLQQREFIDWIREKLIGTGLDVLLPALRTVEFSRAEQSSGVVQRGKESLGRSVEAAVHTADTFPTSAEVMVSMCSESSGFYMPSPLTLYIDPLPNEQRFKVWLDGEAVRELEFATMSFMKRRITDCVRDLLGNEEDEESTHELRVLIGKQEG